MFKKITLASVATLALIIIPAHAKCQGGKCGSGMMKNTKSSKGASCDKGSKNSASPYLISLPSLSKFIKSHENDPRFGLDAKQKEKLKNLRKEMMPKMKGINKDISTLSGTVQSLRSKNAKLSDLKENIIKLAKLKTDATMIKLECIEKVNEVLNTKQKEQMKAFVKEAGAGKAMKKGMKKSMKCQAGKCGGAK